VSKVITGAVMAVLALSISGCGEATVSPLAPAGEAAAEIARITWIMIAATLLLMVVMSALGLHAVYRRNPEPSGPSPRAVILAGGVIVPTLLLLVLLVYGVRAGDAMLAIGEADVEVRVTAHQWWWQFEYSGADGETVHTANELHLPVGQATDIVVESVDVIHAFWVPALGGKIDAIPGRSNRIRLRPTAVGRFRGQCAEFCGAQHARMAFDVQVHEVEDFEALVASLQGLDRTMAGPERGHELFERHCIECHSRSTHQDHAGPNLARLPERPWLGAGTLENTPENLRRWIADHQALKPGNHMPDHGDLDEDSVEALARYLEAQ
jgi:cytochrome c oxidase subunit II